VLSVRGRCFSGENQHSDYYIHLILTPLIRELKEEEEMKETCLLSKKTMRFIRQKLLIIEVKIIYQEISSGIASLFKSQNSEIRDSAVKYRTLNCRRDQDCKFTCNAGFVNDNDSLIAAALKDTLKNSPCTWSYI
jgi:hypothetical protein